MGWHPTHPLFLPISALSVPPSASSTSRDALNKVKHPPKLQLHQSIHQPPQHMGDPSRTPPTLPAVPGVASAAFPCLWMCSVAITASWSEKGMSMPGAVPVVVLSSSHFTVKPERAWARGWGGSQRCLPTAATQSWWARAPRYLVEDVVNADAQWEGQQLCLDSEAVLGDEGAAILAALRATTWVGGGALRVPLGPCSPATAHLKVRGLAEGVPQPCPAAQQPDAHIFGVHVQVPSQQHHVGCLRGVSVGSGMGNPPPHPAPRPSGTTGNPGAPQPYSCLGMVQLGAL